MALDEFLKQFYQFNGISVVLCAASTSEWTASVCVRTRMESISMVYFGLTQTCQSSTAYEYLFGIFFLIFFFFDERGFVASLLLHGTSQLFLVAFCKGDGITGKQIGFLFPHSFFKKRTNSSVENVEL